MPISSQQHRLVMEFSAPLLGMIPQKPLLKDTERTKPLTATHVRILSPKRLPLGSHVALFPFYIAHAFCLLIISMDVELNPVPCDKACRTYFDRHHQSIETKIQQLFDCMRQHGDTLNIQIDHQFEQLHQVLENTIHEIQQLKQQHQEDRTSIDQLLEVHNTAHLRLTKIEDAMEKSERQGKET